MNEFASHLWSDLLRGTCVLSATFIAGSLLLRVLRVTSPTWHRVSWCVALLQGWLIFGVTLSVPWHDRPMVAAQPAPLTLPEMPLSDVAATVGNAADAAAADVAVPNPTETPTTETPATETPAIEPPVAKTLAIPAAVWFLVVWIAGIAVVVVRWTAGYLFFLRRLRPATASDPTWQNEWQALQAELGLRREIPLIVTTVHGPMLCRLPRGFAVLVPEALWRGFDARQRRSVLRHELAHYQRGDAWKSLAVRLLALPHWFNPLAWWAVRRFDEAAEWACDDAALSVAGQTPPSFARTLLELGTVAAAPLSHSPAASGHCLARRIRRMLSVRPSEDHLWKKSLVLLVGALAVLLNVIRIELIAKAAPPVIAEQSGSDENIAFAQADEPPAKPKKTLKAKLPAAVQKGVDYLFSQQQPDGSWKIDDDDTWKIGGTSLCTLALLECGVASDEPQMKTALQYLRSQQPKRTYEISLQTLALCAAAEPRRDAGQIAANVKLLEKGQVQQGRGTGAWSYGTDGVINLEGGDNSNSEFAVWALDAAADAGIDVKPATWKRSYDYWRNSQLPDGGWAYTARGGKATGSMTCAGIASLMICHKNVHKDATDEVPDIQELIQPSVDWLARNFSVNMNPQNQHWQLYYLMVLRNAGALSGIQRFGERSWYAEGSTYLTAHQSPLTGSWKGAGHMEEEIVATAMALLFLRDGKPVAAAETSAVEPAEPDPEAARQAAIDKLTELGAKITVSHMVGDHPVYMVDLELSRVTDADLVHLKELGRISGLQIGHTRITDAGLAHIMQLESLGSLRLEISKVTLAGLRELWRVFPRLDITGIKNPLRGDPQAAKELLRAAGDEILARAAAQEASIPRSPLEKQILAELKRRDDAVRSYQFQWTQRETIHKGSPVISYGGRVGETIEEDITKTGTSELIVDGRKVRYSYTAEPGAGGKDARASFIYAFNGEVERSHYYDWQPAQRDSSREYFANRSFAARLAVTSLPRTLYSTFDPVLRDHNWMNARLLDEQQEIQGRPCDVFQFKHENPNSDEKKSSAESWWIDPSQGYALVRYAWTDAEGRVSRQTDVNYQQDAEHGWVPSLWRIRGLDGDGNVTTTIIARVTQYKINPELPEETFTIDFPPGAIIDR